MHKKPAVLRLAGRRSNTQEQTGRSCRGKWYIFEGNIWKYHIGSFLQNLYICMYRCIRVPPNGYEEFISTISNMNRWIWFFQPDASGHRRCVDTSWGLQRESHMHMVTRGDAQAPLVGRLSISWFTIDPTFHQNIPGWSWLRLVHKFKWCGVFLCFLLWGPVFLAVNLLCWIHSPNSRIGQEGEMLSSVKLRRWSL